jgi:hypothetical protein
MKTLTDISGSRAGDALKKVISPSSQTDFSILDETKKAKRLSAAANDSRSIRNILIFDNHPASLRLVREVYLAPLRPTLPEYILVSVLLSAALVVGLFWIA